MKRFDLADVFTQRGWVVQDSIYTRESKSKAQEYASKFELKEKELQLAKSHLLCPNGVCFCWQARVS